MTEEVEYPIEHQANHHRFVLTVDGSEAELTYQRKGDILVIDHTAVPEHLQHRGLANQLAQGALAYATEHNLKVDPQCRFMEVYLQRHKQYEHLLVGRITAQHPPHPMAGGTR